ncbi:MAG: hypothetical protein GX564_09575 [Oligosphaeraceae bacterium]|nr:hypothetical protein [Oligosphaeraceae bacterium]
MHFCSATSSRAAAVAVLLLAVLLSGCSTLVDAHRQKAPLLSEYLTGQPELALSRLERKLQEPRWYNSSVVGSGDELMWRLEAGSLNFLLDRHAEGIAQLTRAENLVEDYDQRARVNLRQLGSESALLWTNLNALPYRGYCRDRIMLPLFKAFSFLGQGNTEAFRVELFRLRQNQDRVMEEYAEFFQAEEEAMAKNKARHAEAASNADPQRVLADARNGSLNQILQQTSTVAHRGYENFLNPFAIFMSAYGFAREGDWQNAMVDYQRLYQALPNNPLVRQYYRYGLQRTRRDIPPELQNVPELEFSPGRKSLLLIFANGRSASLRQVSLYVPIIYPGYSTVSTAAWPVCEFHPLPYRYLEVQADGQFRRTAGIADMNGILAQEYNQRLPGMITRIILSTAIKELSSYFANRMAKEANSLVHISTLVGTSLYKIAFNTADTRTWEILPGEFQVLELAMPRQREITLSPDGRQPLQISIPETAESAVVYVNAPSGSPAALAVKVFVLQ